MSPMRRRRHYWGDPHRGSARSRPLAEGPLVALRRAHRLLEQGAHAQAAPIFERLAYGARDIGLEQRAPNLLLKGGLAYHLAGDHQSGAKMVHDGLEMLAQGGEWSRLQRMGWLVVRSLQTAGLDSHAQDIQTWLDQALAGRQFEDSAVEPADEGRSRLPLTCPNCGANVHPAEVTRIDNNTAECAYCGGMLPAG